MTLTGFLWIAFLASFVVQTLFWGVVFMRFVYFLKKEKHPVAPPAERPVSIIICARNEVENLKTNLPAILNQEYNDFEVLVVDDGSSDETSALLSEFQMIYAHLTILYVGDKPDGLKGKKYALERGIIAARNPWLLMTDADCIPASNQWITEMNAGLAPGREIGLGFSPYIRQKGMLNRLIRFETVNTAVQYFSFALWGMPYMGVGRNLFYHRSLFEKANGFSSHAHIASGDDDLFIHAVATKSNTDLIIDKKSYVFSKPEVTWRDYLRQKSRHMTTGKYYRLKIKVLLFLFSLSHFMFYLTFLCLLVLEFRCTTVLFVLFGLRLFFLNKAYRVILQKLKEKDLIIWIPILDPLYILFFLFLTPALLLTNMRTWK